MIKLMREDKAMKHMRGAILKAQEFSKDRSTKVAAVVLGRHALEHRTSGYNGMPRGCNDDAPARHERPEKYFWFEHAERNAIYNAARVGIPLEGSILLVTLTPCMDCARAIVGSGIEGVISLSSATTELGKRWDGHFDKADELFAETGVIHERIHPLEIIETAPPELRAYFTSILLGPTGLAGEHGAALPRV